MFEMEPASTGDIAARIFIIFIIGGVAIKLAEKFLLI